jgi:hypothetical protein
VVLCKIVHIRFYLEEQVARELDSVVVHSVIVMLLGHFICEVVKAWRSFLQKILEMKYL